MKGFDSIILKLPDNIRNIFLNLPNILVKDIEEIRLRSGQEIRIQVNNREKIFPYVIDSRDLQKTLNRLIEHSYYAYEKDLAQGFVTIQGGHRVGICGKSVCRQGQIVLLKEISSLNIRFAKEYIGCSDPIMKYIYDISDDKLNNTLIVSPPNCGKTTMLRDIARNLSYMGKKIAINDERSEIAGMVDTIPSFDLGPRVDVLDCCAKYEGIPMLIRSMSPEVIITDEIGKDSDLEAIEFCINAGVNLITSIHGNTLEDVKNSNIGGLINKGFFKTIIYMSNINGPGKIKKVSYD